MVAVAALPLGLIPVSIISCGLLIVTILLVFLAGKKGENYKADIKKSIVNARLKQGKSWGELHRLFGLPKDSIRTIVKNYQQRGSFKTFHENAGRPRKTTERLDRHLFVEAKRTPFTTLKILQKVAAFVDVFVSKKTVARRLKEKGLKARRPRKCPFRKPRHLKARLKFAREYKDKPLKFWDTVLFTDESKIGQLAINVLCSTSKIGL